jgi:queuine tRNA-ribosyltransferase
MELSLRWAERSRRAHEGNPNALFGIVQGGMHRRCARVRAGSIEIGFDGYAIGGLAGGRARGEREHAARPCRCCPRTPRYLMGVGARGHRRGACAAASTCSIA